MIASRQTVFVSAVVFTVAAMLYSCKEKYFPELKEANINYLVVEGLINTGTDSTIYTLTRTYKLDGKAVTAPERNALVQVESNGGEVYQLSALLKPGRYGRPSFGADPTKKYRLRIVTANKREYLSDFVESKTSQPFDFKYDFDNEALNFHITTHDPSGKSIYYQHSFVETWEYETLLNRRGPYGRCWHVVPSPNILLSSTANLSEDRINDKLILSVPGLSPKLDVEYSVLIRQTALTREGFDFFETLRKNTEAVGTIFDAQPSQLPGNIRCITNPAEPVVGFISSGTVTEKRFLIQLADLPTKWFSIPDASECTEPPNPPPFCTDCRVQGGTIQMPSYWK
ncbi:DUF4249 domain-containing protein [Mucilaginibacter calamicampi]|uniref:DUF4249 domain-containing protein n=1 Tax=Mucilaginibacter calamicampi TaxID=1302352 RepID=A0ABW2YTK3_9SPHI